MMKIIPFLHLLLNGITCLTLWLLKRYEQYIPILICLVYTQRLYKGSSLYIKVSDRDGKVERWLLFSNLQKVSSYYKPLFHEFWIPNRSHYVSYETNLHKSSRSGRLWLYCYICFSKVLILFVIATKLALMTVNFFLELAHTKNMKNGFTFYHLKNLYVFIIPGNSGNETVMMEFPL